MVYQASLNAMAQGAEDVELPELAEAQAEFDTWLAEPPEKPIVDNSDHGVVMRVLFTRG
jgi:hypothetical protein